MAEDGVTVAMPSPLGVVGSYATSTGTAHCPVAPIPEKPMQWRYLKDLPPGLCTGFAQRPVTLADVYLTTTRRTYGRDRTQSTPSSWPCRHSLAAPHWKVHYTKHTIEKCNELSWCPALTIGNQSSEMKAQFQGKPDGIATRVPDSSHLQPLPHTLRHHLNSELTKALPATTVNTAAEGRELLASEGGILNRLEPYLTNNHNYHRHFTRHELSQYPRKDAATYWQYQHHPKKAQDVMEDEGKVKEAVTMRDRMVFPTPVMPSTFTPTPVRPLSKALRTLYSDMYASPPESKTRKLFHCPVPPLPPVTKDRTQMEAVTHMYESTYSTYGKLPANIAE